MIDTYVGGKSMRLVSFLFALVVFIFTVFSGHDNFISGLILFVCLVLMVLSSGNIKSEGM